MPFFVRHRKVIFTIYLLLSPLVIYGAIQSFRQGANRPEDWLPDAFAESQVLRWFQSHFVADDLLVVSWEGSEIGDPRVEALADFLRQPRELPDGTTAVLTRRVLTTSEVLEQLREDPLSLSRREAISRLSGWLVSEDGATGCLIVLLDEAGWEHRELLIDSIYAFADQLPGLSGDEVRMAGTTLHTVAIDRVSKERLRPLMIGSYTVCFLLMLVLLRSFLLSLLVFVNALFCQQLSLALIIYTGSQMDSVLLIVPSLVFVLVVSTSVHMLNYYLDAVLELGVEEAPVVAARKAMSPCFLSTATTSIGLLSLMISALIPVQKFGLYATLGLVCSTVSLFLVFPGQLKQFAPWVHVSGKGLAVTARRSQCWSTLLVVIEKFNVPIMLATLVMFGVSGWGLSHLESSARIHDLFTPQSRMIQDYHWFEEKFGPLVPLEIVLEIPTPPEPMNDEPPALRASDRLRLVATAHQLVAQHEEVGAVVSPVNFAPPLEPRRGDLLSVAREAILARALDKHATSFAEMGYLRQLDDSELWRISVRAYAGERLDYGSVLEELEERLAPLLERAAELGFGEVRAVFSGGVPLVQQTQQQMLVDLGKGFLSAAGLITVMMVVLSFRQVSGTRRAQGNETPVGVSAVKSTLAGVVSMIPNLLPCVLVFGAMGWARVPVDIGTLLTASVALGIAVDDTLHFLVAFWRAMDGGASRRHAVLAAYRQCGMAMVQTSLICGLGLLVYIFSPFVPISRFALLISLMMGSALLADLIVLPAFLLGFPGRLFHQGRETA